MTIIDIRKAVRRTNKMESRTIEGIDCILVHKSGGEGADDERGAVASTAYVVDKRGFPGPAYHYWIARTGKVFLCASHSDRCWHTGADANRRGIGVAIQGDTDKRDLTDAQKKSLSALLEHLASEFGFDPAHAKDWLGWHSIGTSFGAKKNKSVCPGKFGVAFLQSWIAERANVE